MSKLSLADLQLKKAKEEQKKLDQYLAEVQDYFECIADEDENENYEREQYWIERNEQGNPLVDFKYDARGREISFDNDAGKKSKDCELPLTQDHIDEYTYCAYHPIYTIRNYFKIINIDHGLVNFKLYDFQEQLVKNFFFNNRLLAMFSRQSGKTSTIAACLLFYSSFNKDKNIGIIANKKSTANEVLERIKLMYIHLPNWLKPGIVKWNEGTIEFDNGCKIITSATTATSIRGKSLAVLYIDEISHIGKKMWDAFYKSTFPVISSSKLAKIAITTTPNGKDHFYYMWQDAIKGNSSFVTQKVRWYEIPGRDEEWKKKALAELGNNLESFGQEYLVEFLSASIEYISLERLEQYEQMISPPKAIDSNLKLNIFEQPQDKHSYIMTVDVSEGKGLDHQALAIVDCSEMPLKIVATLKNNKIDTIQYASIIYQLALKYNEAHIIIENNFSDVAKDLWFNYEYTNIINMNLRKQENRQGKYFEIGLRTTPKTRRIGEEYFKHLVENDKIILNDIRIIKELNNLEFNEARKRFEPRDTQINDDLWAALKGFSYIAKTMFFEAMLKNGSALQLFKVNSEDEQSIQDNLSLIIKPVVVEATSAPKKKKFRDAVEKKWDHWI